VKISPKTLPKKVPEYHLKKEYSLTRMSKVVNSGGFWYMMTL
jgi:hypothetical protein